MQWASRSKQARKPGPAVTSPPATLPSPIGPPIVAPAAKEVARRTSVATAELLQRLAGGDQTAFAQLYEATSPSIIAAARRLLRDPHQAEEVAHEVLLEIWQRAAQYDAAQGSASAWISRITHARTVDRIRQSQASRQRDDRYAGSDIDRNIDLVAESTTQRIDCTTVQTALTSLTALQRESIYWAFYCGKTYREIASILGTPLPTVKGRVRDGLLHLRRILDEGDFALALTMDADSRSGSMTAAAAAQVRPADPRRDGRGGSAMAGRRAVQVRQRATRSPVVQVLCRSG